MSLRVVLDKNLCQSSGNCVTDAPEAFGFDPDELGDVRESAGRLPRQRLVAIAKRCPALAIEIYDEEGEEVFAG